MIVYDKLANLLKERNMTWKDLCQSGISTNMPTKFSHNKTMNTEIINKVCEYVCVQPSVIMEWIPDAEYESNKKKKLAIEAKIAELQAQLKNM